MSEGAPSDGVSPEGELMLKFPCPHCGQRISVGESAAGATGNCPSCTGQLVVPAGPPPLPLPGSPRQPVPVGPPPLPLPGRLRTPGAAARPVVQAVPVPGRAASELMGYPIAIALLILNTHLLGLGVGMGIAFLVGSFVRRWKESVFSIPYRLILGLILGQAFALVKLCRLYWMEQSLAGQHAPKGILAMMDLSPLAPAVILGLLLAGFWWLHRRPGDAAALALAALLVALSVWGWILLGKQGTALRMNGAEQALIEKIMDRAIETNVGMTMVQLMIAVSLVINAVRWAKLPPALRQPG